MSAGPSNTDVRGVSANVSPPQATVPPPESGRIITSVPPVCIDTDPSSARSRTCKEDSAHPASSGVIATVNGAVALRAGM